MEKLAVFTSGGDAPGMNACVRAVVRTALHKGYEVIGIRRGYQGMIEGDFWQMSGHDVSGIIQQGGTILRSARSPEFRTVEGMQKAYDNLRKENITKVVAIGGDGSFKGASAFMDMFPDISFTGCPGTIDNDLSGTDFTIGYDTAINTAMNAVDNIKDTANAHDRLFFIEVMGRDAGFIALPVSIATGAEAVLVPESITDLDHVVQILRDGFNKKKNSSIVIVSEGDSYGGAFSVANEVEKRLPGCYEIKVSVLGHLQRGGRPTCMDRVRASRMGIAAVEALHEGRKGVMIGEVNNKIVEVPFKDAIKTQHALDTTLLSYVEGLC